jgi:hypothetical protein
VSMGTSLSKKALVDFRSIKVVFKSIRYSL